jgi:hypothetical protein
MSINGRFPIFLFQKRNNNIETLVKERDNYDLQQKRIKIDNYDFANVINNWNGIKSFDIKEIGTNIPIPFTFCEEMGIVLTSENKKINNKLDWQEGFIIQARRENSLTLNLRAKSNSIILSSFIGALQYMYNSTENYNYAISYFNNFMYIKQGYLGSFDITTNSNTGDYNISLLLEEGQNLFDKVIEKNKKSSKNEVLGSNLETTPKTSTQINVDSGVLANS